jgi:hypothetical protein
MSDTLLNPMRPNNWPIWLALPFSLATVFSYPFVFVRWPLTRDLPWVNLLMAVATLALVAVGIRRALAAPGRLVAKSLSVLVGALAVAGLWMFVYGVMIVPRRLPVSTGAPQIGQHAPDFSAADVDAKAVSLSRLLSDPLASGAAPRALLLIFYRGYW